MRRDLDRVKDMTNKEIMYIVASEYIDDICMAAVNQADEIMSNPILKDMICRAAENMLRYAERRKKIALGEEEEKDCWYGFLTNDIRAYKTVLYDSFFYQFGSNDHDI